MTTQQTLHDVLPAAAQEVVAKSLNEDFKATLKLPKGFNRFLIARAIDRVILEKVPVNELHMGLTSREKDYIALVAQEYAAWETSLKAPATEETKS